MNTLRTQNAQKHTKTQNLLCLLCFCVLFVILISPQAASAQIEQQQQQQQQQQKEADEAARREEAARRAEEARRQQEFKQQMEETRKRMDALRPPTPEERRAMRARMFLDFIKDVDKFEQLTSEITQAVSPKDIRKKANTIEDRVHDMLKFVLDWEKAPPAPQLQFQDPSVQGRVSFLAGLSESLIDKLRQYIESEEQRLTINVTLLEELIRDLQIAKLASRSLQK